VCPEGQHETKEGPKVGGNVLSFLKCLWQRSYERTNGHTKALAEERKLLWPDTLTQWGVARSIINGNWLLPAYDVNGKFCQLYKLVKGKSGRMELHATSGLGHGLFAPMTWDRKATSIHLTEGPWDGMALWEVLKSAKETEDGLAETGSESSSLLAGSAVLAIPGCGSVGTPFAKWAPLFAGKRVILCFDSDHPRQYNGQDVPPAGFDASKRAVRILSAAEKKPSRVEWLEWGVFGYDPSLKSGFDVRDLLSQGETLPERIKLLGEELLPKIKPIPSEWLSTSSSPASRPGSVQIEPLRCESWAELKNCWRKAMEWSEGLEKALAAMLATVLSTRLSDDPLWIKVMSPASTGKSTLCEALAVATDWVFPLSKMTGMHSGWKTDKKGEEDHGLVPLIQNKTLVIKDGDTLLTSADPSKVFGELRDLYDGAARVHYLHGISRRYDNIKLGIIICGTDSLRKIDSSELGERFLDVVMMEKIDEDSERNIGLRTFWRVVRNATENGDESSIALTRSKEMVLAMQMTAGYVNFLREQDVQILHGVAVDEEIAERCNDLGKFVSCLRARPSRHQEEHSSRELSSRLVGQIGKLAICLAGVYQRKSVDEPVMAQVRQIAFDTARGTTLDMVRWLFKQGTQGNHRSGIATVTNQTHDRTTKLLRFLRAIGVTEYYHKGGTAGVVEGQEMWRLTESMRGLFGRVMRDAKS
jgi:hypothetical protein